MMRVFIASQNKKVSVTCVTNTRYGKGDRFEYHLKSGALFEIEWCIFDKRAVQIGI